MTTPVSDRPKMATDIPEGITIPDTLETRLGTLRFSDGFPDDATVEKVFDNLDFQRGVQAVLTAMPAASIETQRRTFLERVGAGSAYAAAFVDSKNEPFDGAKHYRLRLPSNVPAKTFWSLVLYDNRTRSMLQTDDPHPSISSLKAGIETNPDGSLDVHFGPQPPPGKAHNWVQTWPGKGWNILFRLYGPLEPWFDKTWRLPDIKPIKRGCRRGGLGRATVVAL